MSSEAFCYFMRDLISRFLGKTLEKVAELFLGFWVFHTKPVSGEIFHNMNPIVGLCWPEISLKNFKKILNFCFRIFSYVANIISHLKQKIETG